MASTRSVAAAPGCAGELGRGDHGALVVDLVDAGEFGHGSDRGALVAELSGRRPGRPRRSPASRSWPGPNRPAHQPHAAKIRRALDDADEEVAKKTSASKDELGRALDRALGYAKSADAFATVATKLAPHVRAAVAWLGDTWTRLLRHLV